MDVAVTTATAPPDATEDATAVKAAPAHAGVPVNMPNMDLIITEATVVGWLKKVGDAVRKGEPLLEVETDKAVTNVESPADGILAEILADAGAVVTVGTTTGDHLAMSTNPRIPASPRARREMRQRGIDPTVLRGSGPRGRIVVADVLRLAATPASPRPNGDGPSALAATGSGRARIPEQPGATTVSQVGELTSMRRAVAAKVAESFATVPHFYLRSEVNVTSLVQLRQQIVQAFEKSGSLRPSVTDFLLRAIALALRDCPHANRIWQNDAIVQLPTVDVGLVVQVGDGLMVPVIHRADRLGLMELAHRRSALTDAVRSGKTPANVLQGGATSLTNLGRRRVDEFAPIISPPQSSMLAVGRIAERPAAWEGRICLRQMMYITLAVNHRVMDGVPAAEFLDRIVNLLERPFALFCEVPSRLGGGLVLWTPANA